MSTAEPTPDWDTDAILTVPNVLSFLRLLSVIALGVLIILEHDVAAVVLLVIFGSTDWLDGFIARRFNQRSELGTKLDPLADRLYIVVAVVALTVRGIVPWWFLVILIVRDLMLLALVPLLKRRGRVTLDVNLVGKAATLALLLAFPILLIGYSTQFGLDWFATLGWVVAIIGAVLYWAAGVLYVRATRQLLGAPEPTPLDPR